MNLNEYIRKHINRKSILVLTTIFMVVVFIFIIYKSYKIAKIKNDINNLPLIKSDVDIIKIKHEIKELPLETNSFYETFKNDDNTEKKIVNVIDEEKIDNEMLPVINKNITVDVAENTLDKNKINNNIKNSKNIVELNNYENKRIDDNEAENKDNKDSNELNKSKTTDEKGKRIDNGEIIKYKSDSSKEQQSSNIKEVIINEKKEEIIKVREKDLDEEVINDNFYRAQLVALKNRQQAVIFVEKTKKRYSNILKGLELFITEINLNEKGIFYRVQVGNFKNKSDANSFCDDYRKYSNVKDLVNCIVVK